MARRDEDYWRQRAKVLYRALRDDFGARGATVRELMPLIGATDTSGVFMTLNWMRAQGVRIVCARDRQWFAPSTPEERSSRTVPFPSRWALYDSLPPDWAAMLPVDGSDAVVMDTVLLSEVTKPPVAKD
jgi:hypothetical protein